MPKLKRSVRVMSDTPGPHIGLGRLVAFLMEANPLTPDERTHLLHCEDCRRTMVRAAEEEARVRTAEEQLRKSREKPE
jgi:hypothetical protein